MVLKDKVVVITGGSRGLGRAMAVLFKNEGANVSICSSNEVEVLKTAEEIGVFGMCADVTKEEDLNNLKQQTLNKFGGIDIWINNAGIWLDGVFENTDMDKARKMFDINLMGTIYGSKVVLPLMKEKNSGAIVNIISQAGLYGRAGYSLYAASKWGVNGFTKSIRLENKDTDISFVSIYPGGIKTTIFGEEKLPNYDNFMDVDDVAKRIVRNMKQEEINEELSITQED
jgi:uncharacterized protein